MDAPREIGKLTMGTANSCLADTPPNQTAANLIPPYCGLLLAMKDKKSCLLDAPAMRTTAKSLPTGDSCLLLTSNWFSWHSSRDVLFPHRRQENKINNFIFHFALFFLFSLGEYISTKPLIIIHWTVWKIVDGHLKGNLRSFSLFLPTYVVKCRRTLLDANS